MPISLAVTFPPAAPTEALRPFVRAAAESGLDELWLSEDCFHQGGLTAVASALAWSEGSALRVGAGLLPAPLHQVAATAMDVAALAAWHPGRVAVALGHGIQPWMAQAGAAVDSPLTLLREQLTALRALLHGEEVSVAGRYVTLDAVQLAQPPEPGRVPPVLVGGAGPRTLALAGPDGPAEGTVLALGSGEVEVAAQRAATTGELAVPLLVSVAADTAQAQALLEAEREGYGMPADAPVGLAGSAADVAAAVRGLEAAGADTVCLQVPAGVADLPAHLLDLVGEVREALLAD